MAVTTGAPHDTCVAAIGTNLMRATESRGAAAFDGPQGGELLAGKLPRPTKTIAVGSNEVCQFEPTSPPPAVRAGRLAGHDLPRSVEQIERRTDRGQPRLTQVKVAHRGRDAAMTQQTLYCRYVRSGFDEMSRKSVA